MKETQISKVRKAEFAGPGAIVQLLGVACIFVAFPFGLFAAIPLLLIGSQMSLSWQCGKCRGKIEKAASICPHCHVPFTQKGTQK